MQAQRGELAELEARNVGKAISSVRPNCTGIENSATTRRRLVDRRPLDPIGGSLLFYSLKEPSASWSNRAVNYPC